MVFQNYALSPHDRSQNVGFERRCVGSQSLSVMRVGEAIALVALGDFGDRFPGQLSGGQQQRVAVARALVLKPRFCFSTNPYRTWMPSCDRRCASGATYPAKRQDNDCVRNARPGRALAISIVLPS
jgi:ABC-type arginine transport system ATPase subunit